MGIVESLSQDSIKVSFGKNRTYEIYPHEFEAQEAIYKDKKIKYETFYSVSQYPIVPAYAITIHKSQGQTYREIACDINKCFASGQAYVALSRCESLEGLHLRSELTSESIRVDREVLEFYKSQTEAKTLQLNA